MIDPVTYTIPKGKHGAKGFVPRISCGVTKMHMEVCFHPSCRYQLPSPAAQSAVNKLFGWSQDIYHHWASGRVGWRYLTETDKIQLVAYCYRRSERVFWEYFKQGRESELIICELDIEEKTDVMIELFPDKFHFSHCGILMVSVGASHRVNVGYELGPDFGGQIRAPHDMKLSLTSLL